MVTIIIPTLNEAETIGNIVRFCLNNVLAGEVIVVDDNSDDETVAIALAAGAKVINSKIKGKGISMKEGIQKAAHEILLFLDGDIDPYPEDTINLLATPLINDEADFVKATFARNAGRVTELVAKPLLNIYYPGLSGFSQPLSGMIAGRKKFFNRIEFFNDYGVDIGILIDMYLMKARIKEVNIGYIENKSKPWESLGKMSKEVSRAIIAKAQPQSEFNMPEEEISSIETIQREMHNTLKEDLSRYHKLIVFDLDDIIFNGRFIDECAAAFGFTRQLEELRFNEKDPIILTKRIGLLLKGKTMDDLLNIVSDIEMVKDIQAVVQALKEKEYIVGVISHSYLLIANYVRQNIGGDFSYANQLDFYEGKATGEVNMPSYFFASPESICGHAYCKTNALQYACDKYNVLLKNCIVVGDDREDRCILTHAGKGVAFCTSDELLEKIAYITIKEKSFKPLLNIA
ncbi:glycosyltransferase [Agriterribacter sp.]|uniref:glycosyltransferase n=1 Tax=Agriterribacter sp. TaxID=2821509 RepID=UPI002BBDB71F|nr:glycosyltransferase [Agriterribacter sp.]HRO47764.1 glycosyltransferase [Agriterribacter sp.]HRQ18350.1 glycosyltransferase [Agriterribacter sp.]